MVSAPAPPPPPPVVPAALHPVSTRAAAAAARVLFDLIGVILRLCVTCTTGAGPADPAPHRRGRPAGSPGDAPPRGGRTLARRSRAVHTPVRVVSSASPDRRAESRSNDPGRRRPGRVTFPSPGPVRRRWATPLGGPHGHPRERAPGAGGGRSGAPGRRRRRRRDATHRAGDQRPG